TRFSRDWSSDVCSSDLVTEDRQRPTRSEVSRQARDISSSTGNIYDQPLARIEDRLCPGVIGLKQRSAELMVDRIRWNAERLDMKIGRASCRERAWVAVG